MRHFLSGETPPIVLHTDGFSVSQWGLKMTHAITHKKNHNTDDIPVLGLMHHSTTGNRINGLSNCELDL